MENVEIGVVWGLRFTQGHCQYHHLIKRIQLPISL